MRQAGFFRRALAFLLDSPLLLVFYFASSLLFQKPFKITETLLLSIQVSGQWPKNFQYFMLCTLGLTFFLFYLYNAFFNFCMGGTPAKRLFNLRIYCEGTNHYLSFSQSFLREVIGKFLSLLFLGLGFLRPLFAKDKMAFHDILAGTEVRVVS